MGFLDFIFGDNRRDNNYQIDISDSNNDYDNNNYSDEEYDDEDYSSDESDILPIDESDPYTHGIYTYEKTHEDWEWECNIVNYPNRRVEPWKTIESHMEAWHIEKAEEYLKNYFRGAEKDTVYYFAMAYLYYHKTRDYLPPLFEDIQRAKSHINNAASHTSNDSIWISLISHLIPKINESYDKLKAEKYLREEFKKEWADVIYGIRYSNMDTYLPRMGNLAQKIRLQLATERGSGEFLNAVAADMNTWGQRYAENLIQNGHLDEAATAATQISDMKIKVDICKRLTATKIQKGDFMGAEKIATQLDDMDTLARTAARYLTKLINDRAEKGSITHQLFVVSDAIRRASSLIDDKDTLNSLKIDVKEAVDTARKYLYDEPIVATVDETPNPVNTQSPISTTNQSSDTAYANETEFIEELKACLEDGALSDKHRRLLDRVRKSLGISEARAAELEAMCQPKSLTAEEQEYADEVQACLEDDGVITAKERRLLSRIADSLGISAERTAEIESMMAK